jgi:hypothetical protein
MRERGYTPAMIVLATHPSASSASAATASGWPVLEAELDLWHAAGRTATLWWRDDDTIDWTPALERLLALAEDTPVALAVIPGTAQARLAERLARIPAVAVLHHGWRHTNHAPAGAPKSELGGERPLQQRLDELRLGRERLRALFGPRALGVLVPPWNRIAPDLVPLLPGIGVHGLSVTGARRPAPVPGLRLVNVHADLIEWQGSRGFFGENVALDLLLQHLRARRLRQVDAEEPTGILTHHLVQDEPTARFLRRLIAVARAHPAARFMPVPELFPAP